MIVAEPVVVAPEEAGTTAELLQRGLRDQAAGRCTAAVRRLRRVLRVASEPARIAQASYALALCQEQLGHHERSASAFERAASTDALPVAEDAAIRAIRLWIFLERFERAKELATRFASRVEQGSSPRDQVVVYGALALGWLEQDDLDAAEYWIAKGRVVVGRHSLDAGGALPRDLAQLFYALGELRRRRAERIVFTPLPANFAEVFERRAQLVLDAQSAYSDVMRAEDAHWTAMAGYRVGELYEKLHAEVAGMPRPEGARRPPHRALFDGAMRLRYLVLMEKGLSMFEHTLSMAERTRERSVWVARAREARDRLRQRIEAENDTIDSSGYSRDELRRVLEEIQHRQN